MQSISLLSTEEFKCSYHIYMYHASIIYVFTLSRRNWKQRYFALREKTLFYYADSDLANAKPNGAIDLGDVT